MQGLHSVPCVNNSCHLVYSFLNDYLKYDAFWSVSFYKYCLFSLQPLNQLILGKPYFITHQLGGQNNKSAENLKCVIGCTITALNQA